MIYALEDLEVINMQAEKCQKLILYLENEIEELWASGNLN